MRQPIAPPRRDTLTLRVLRVLARAPLARRRLPRMRLIRLVRMGRMRRQRWVRLRTPGSVPTTSTSPERPRTQVLPRRDQRHPNKPWRHQHLLRVLLQPHRRPLRIRMHGHGRRGRGGGRGKHASVAVKRLGSVALLVRRRPGRRRRMRSALLLGRLPIRTTRIMLCQLHDVDRDGPRETSTGQLQTENRAEFRWFWPTVSLRHLEDTYKLTRLDKLVWSRRRTLFRTRALSGAEATWPCRSAGGREASAPPQATRSQARRQIGLRAAGVGGNEQHKPARTPLLARALGR